MGFTPDGRFAVAELAADVSHIELMRRAGSLCTPPVEVHDLPVESDVQRKAAADFFAMEATPNLPTRSLRHVARNVLNGGGLVVRLVATSPIDVEAFRAQVSYMRKLETTKPDEPLLN